MIRQNVNIVNFRILYDILDEIKENLPFNIIRQDNEEDFLKDKENDLQDFLVITNLDKKNLDKENLLILSNLPMALDRLIELINTHLIKIRFNHQSKINIKSYELNLNSKFLSKNSVDLKLTEKEIEIVLYLSKNKKKHSILDLQKNIWDYSFGLETHTVETHIYRLRKKIKNKFDDSNFILSHEDGYFIS